MRRRDYIIVFLFCIMAEANTNEVIIKARAEFLSLFDRMYTLCHEMGWGDPFNYSRAREIQMANILGHSIAKQFSGEDATDEDGPCEYKSTTTRDINATYNGISKYPTWEEQEFYLRNKKIGGYKNHYYARYCEGTLVEIYKMSCDKVLEILIPKLRNQYHTDQTRVKPRKDPRLGSKVVEKEIKKFATKIYPQTNEETIEVINEETNE